MLKLSYYLEYAALRLFCPAIRLLPGDLAVKLGGKIGAMSSAFIKERIKLAHANLELAFGNTLSNSQREEIIRSLLQMLGEALAESIVFTHRDIKKHITVEGMEHLEKALERGNGVVAVSAHIGNYALIGPRLTREGYNFLMVIRDLKSSVGSKVYAWGRGS